MRSKLGLSCCCQETLQGGGVVRPESWSHPVLSVATAGLRWTLEVHCKGKLMWSESVSFACVSVLNAEERRKYPKSKADLLLLLHIHLVMSKPHYTEDKSTTKKTPVIVNSFLIWSDRDAQTVRGLDGHTSGGVHQAPQYTWALWKQREGEGGYLWKSLSNAQCNSTLTLLQHSRASRMNCCSVLHNLNAKMLLLDFKNTLKKTT